MKAWISQFRSNPCPVTRNGPTCSPMARCRMALASSRLDAGDRSRRPAPHSDPDHIPTTLVAVKGGEPVGSVSLLEQDLAGWEHLTPWLASLYVRSDHRGRGIGKQLVAQGGSRGPAHEGRRVVPVYAGTPGVLRCPRLAYRHPGRSRRPNRDRHVASAGSPWRWLKRMMPTASRSVSE